MSARRSTVFAAFGTRRSRSHLSEGLPFAARRGTHPRAEFGSSDRPRGVRPGAGRAALCAARMRRRAGRSSRSVVALAGVFGYELLSLRGRDAVRTASIPTSGWRVASPTPSSSRSSRIATRAQRRLDDRDAPVARRRLPFDGAAGFRRVPARGVGRRLCRPLLRRRLGPRRCRSSSLFAGAAARAAGRDVGPLPFAASSLRQQALLLLPLRLPRGMAAIHPHAVDRC